MTIFQKNVRLVYTVKDGERERSFMTTCQVVTRRMTTAAKTKIVLCIPNFTVFLQVTCPSMPTHVANTSHVATGVYIILCVDCNVKRKVAQNETFGKNNWQNKFDSMF
jgi:hypothetical protein